MSQNSAVSAHSIPPELPRRALPAGPSGFDVVKRILTPVASLWTTVILLILCLVLIFAGTSAQKEMSIHDVLNEYFHAGYSFIPFKYFFPLSRSLWNLPGGIYFPGGYTLMSALLVNLVAAHAIRFTLSWKRVGVILIHLSLIVLLVGELAASRLRQEAQLTFNEGQTQDWVHDLKNFELAIVDRSPADHDAQVTISDDTLRKGQLISDQRLPFEIKLERWYDNSKLAGPVEQGDKIDRLATAGRFKDVGIRPLPKMTGVEAERVDLPAAFVSVHKNGEKLGTYVTALQLMRPDQVEIDGKTYDIELRFKREYLPYSLYLIDFSHDKYTGSEMAKNFASRVRLVDRERNITRETVIRMNEPLYYRGRTFYQSSFNPDDPTQTTLQVVNNRVWWAPYVACVMGAIGLLVHFIMRLVIFLLRHVKRVRGNAPALNMQNSGQRNYVLKPRSGMSLIVPIVIVVLGLLVVAWRAMPAPAKKPGEVDYATLSKVPVSFGGRVMPLDTVARTALKIMSGRETIEIDGKKHAAIKWFFDSASGKAGSEDYKAIRIDHPQVKSLLGLPTNEKLFSIREIVTKQPNNLQLLGDQAGQANAVSRPRRDSYQRKILELSGQVSLYNRMRQLGDMAMLYSIWSDPTEQQKLTEKIERTMEARRKGQPLTPEQQALSGQLAALEAQKEFLHQLQVDPQAEVRDLFFVPPDKAGEKWRGFGRVLIDSSQQGSVPPKDLREFASLVQDYRDGNVTSFNADVSAYQASLASRFPADTNKAAFEAFFHRFDPFMISLLFYLLAFVVGVSSWMGWQRPLWQCAMAVILVALIVHTIGLVMRIYISGRPPVTNLYSSAVIIAWGAVIFAMILEALFRDGLALVASAVVGITSLLIAGGLEADGDTMEQLQAVLDTNMWLATHVMAVTLGYAATFLASILGLFYIVGGMATPAMNGEMRKNLNRMTYGVVCFAMLLTFIGTLLGGIWADVSWGRFWGWDPKENGAVLIVIWLAVILHARWGGLVRERGMMVLALLGGVVTSWSWFGTNMMSVGLHAYGFMERGAILLSVYVIFTIAVAITGAVVPIRVWWSYLDEGKDFTSNRRGFEPAVTR